ncbi:MAG: transcriptional repressor [Eubacteriales bacterium]|nr:transcriptional repressor [Eubacteriales bacterium]
MAVRKEYQTKIRTEILDYFRKNRSVTVSAADIRADLKEKGIEANNTTIYRYLDKLCSESMILKYPDDGGDKAVYQYAGEEHHCTEHLHLKCVECGRIFHLDCSFMDELREHLLADHGFHVQCAGDLLHGLCGECWKKEKR